ncbi:hypothetical protein [Runella sp.]|uniref:hypothetical protein n=1 Tax=Runella sp. TaxID=1960881 RepID=UPI003D1127B3
MKKIREFNQISFFKNEPSGLFIQGREINSFLNDDFDEIFTLPTLLDYQVVDCRDYYLITTNFEYTKIYREGDEVLKLYNYGYLLNHENVFLLENYETNVIQLFDIKSNIFSPTYIKKWGQPFWGTSLFIKEKKVLVSYSLTDFSPLWQYELPESLYNWTDGGGYAHKGEIERIIGIYEEILWVSLNSGRLLGINAGTGVLLYNISQPNQYPEGYVFREETKYLWYGRHWQLDSQKGILFGLTSCYYFELDLNKPNETFALYDISATCEQHRIKANMPVLEWSWQGDEIFFGETDFGKGASYAGIFNRQIRQITWTSRELGEEGVFKGINKIEYQANRLYVLDRAGTLHIFERDSPAG